MYIITLKYDGKELQHRVYSREEADREGLRYVPWRSSKTQEWALTDDGYVAQVLNVKVYKTGRGEPRYLRTFAFWSIWSSARAVLSFSRAMEIRAKREEEDPGPSVELPEGLVTEELEKELRRKAKRMLRKQPRHALTYISKWMTSAHRKQHSKR